MLRDIVAVDITPTTVSEGKKAYSSEVIFKKFIISLKISCYILSLIFCIAM